MTELKRTPLYNEQIALKARMVEFAGWEMPVLYASVIKEHEAVRNAVGLFDVSHMGEFFISGPKARAFLNRVTTNDVEKLYDGRCQYSLLCYENGTVVDDLIVSQISDDRYLVVVNASNIEKDFSWLTKHNQEGVDIQNASEEKALLAVQGPSSPAVLQKLFGKDFSDLKYYHFEIINFEGDSVFISRTGYTGEDGFEIMMSPDQSAKYWKKILDRGQSSGIEPVGLAARDTLRLEVGYSLYDHEITDQIIALEAGLGWVVKLSKGEFIGRESLKAIKEQGIKRKIVGFQMVDSGIARDGYKVYEGENEVGFVTSGTHSPSLKKSIGLVLVQKSCSDLDSELWIDVRGKKKKAVVVKTPFYKRS